MQRYASFAQFYPFYLSEHANRATRRLHFLGSALALFLYPHSLTAILSSYDLATT